MESFWSSLKRELVHRCQFATRAQAEATSFEWIEVFYNRERLHSALGSTDLDFWENICQAVGNQQLTGFIDFTPTASPKRFFDLFHRNQMTKARTAQRPVFACTGRVKWLFLHLLISWPLCRRV